MSLLIFYLCLCYVATNALKDTELCSYHNSKFHCRHLHREEASKINFPHDACVRQECAGCIKRWQTLILENNGSLIQPKTFVTSLMAQEDGDAIMLSCKRDGFTCSCADKEICNGSNRFCSIVPCSPNATCLCETLPAVAELKHISSEGVIENPKLLSFLRCAYRESQVNVMHHRIQKRRLLENEDAIFEQHGIIIKYNEPVFTINSMGTLIVRVNGHERIFSIKSERSQAVVPEEYLKLKATMKFIFVNTQGKTMRGEIEIEGREFCRRVTCIFCLELFDQVDCWPPVLKYAMYASLILLSAMVVIYVRAVISILISIVKMFTFLTYQAYKIIRGGGRFSLTAGAALGHRLRRTAAEFQGRLDREANPQLSTLALLMLLALASADCTGHIILKAEQQVCADVKEGIDCSIETHAQLTLPNLEYSQCLWMESSKGEPLFSLKIKLVKAECQWQTVRAYYTYVTDFRQINAVYCPNSDMCGWGTHCKAHKRFYAETKESLSYPGFSSCVAANSAANKCFIIDSEACHFYRLYLIPDYTKTYEVRNIISHSCNYQIEIEENYNDTLEKVQIRTQAVTKKGIHVQIIGAYDQPAQLMKMHLISRVGRPDEAYLDSASEPGRPIAGSIGDVQANQTIAQNFIFAKEMFDCNFYEDTMNCEKKNSYLEQMVVDKASALPKTLAYHHLYINSDGRLMSTMIHTSPVVMALHFRDYKVRMQLTTVCPKFSDTEAKAKGCYSCAPLAQLSFTAHSACKEGVATVSFESISVATRSVHLTTQPKEIIIEFHSEIKCIRDKICLHGRTVHACKVIKFCLDEGTLNIHQPNYTYLSSKQVNLAYSSPAWEWLNFSSFFGLQGLIKFTATILPLAAVGIFLIAAIITSCCR